MEKKILTYNGMPIDYGYYFPSLMFYDNVFPIDYGKYIWFDLEGRCFYSQAVSGSNKQKIFDGTTWTDITLSGISRFNGSYIWNDGTNVYLSLGAGEQYVVTYSNGVLTLTPMTWNGFNKIVGNNVWSDGTNIYYSDGSEKQYALDKPNMAWVAKTWNGDSDFYGINVWTDGSNYYYSEDTKHRIIDTINSTVTNKSWNWTMSEWISARFNGEDVWHFGNKTYYSNFFYMYELDPATSTWKYLVNESSNEFYGGSVWHYDGHTYVNGFYYMGEDYWHGNVPGNPHYVSVKYEILNHVPFSRHNFIDDSEVNP